MRITFESGEEQRVVIGGVSYVLRKGQIGEAVQRDRVVCLRRSECLMASVLNYGLDDDQRVWVDLDILPGE